MISRFSREKPLKRQKRKNDKRREEKKKNFSAKIHNFQLNNQINF